MDAESVEVKSRKVQTDMLGLDESSSGRKMVRLKKAKSGWSLEGIGFQPRPEEAGAGYPELHKELVAHHVSLCYSSSDSIIRLITLPGRADAMKLRESNLREQIGVTPDFRLSYKILPSEGRGETRLLAVAVRDDKAQEIVSAYNQPQPAPISLELAGLASLAAFMKGREVVEEQDAFGFIESGANVNLVAFFCKGQLVLLRKFDFGGDALVDKVQRHLGLEREVAMGLVSEGSFDLSEPVKDVVDPFFRQLSISKDFVERHQRSRLRHLYISGGMSLSRYWIRELGQELGVKVSSWDPFERLDIQGTLPPEFAGSGARYTSCVGAAIGSMEEE